LDGWQRARAEFANFKKRIARENSEIHQHARGEIIKMYLDIVDDLERALQEKPQGEEGLTWAGGIEIIYQKLIKRLESEGIKPMNALGEEFDPNIHEALMKEESDEFESGQIIEVMQEGYWIGEKVLRPALVRVAA
jgi:molecular chaperone GrpE